MLRILAIFGMFIGAVVPYLTIAVVSEEFNPFNWDASTRFATLAVTLLVELIFYVLFKLEDNDPVL